ncbi:hypothetical protein ABIC10_001027 [Bradyrhizobium sp. S3.2.12]
MTLLTVLPRPRTNNLNGRGATLTLNRLMMSFNSRPGAIASQSLAHRSAPNTTMPRSWSRSSVLGVEAKLRKRRNGVDGAIVDMPWSAISSAAIPRSMSSLAFSKLIFDAIECDHSWCARVWSCAASRASSGIGPTTCRPGRMWPGCTSARGAVRFFPCAAAGAHRRRSAQFRTRPRARSEETSLARPANVSPSAANSTGRGRICAT